MNQVRCPKCGGECDTGSISTSEGVFYISDRQQGMLKTMTPARRAYVCLNCGYIELYLNPQELKQKIQK